MNLIRCFRRWISAHDPRTEATIGAALQASKDVEREARLLHEKLDQIKGADDPLGELVHSMRGNKLNGTHR